MQNAQKLMEELSRRLAVSVDVDMTANATPLRPTSLRHMMKLSLIAILQTSLNRIGCGGTRVVELDDTFQMATVICEDGKIGKLKADMLLPE